MSEHNGTGGFDIEQTAVLDFQDGPYAGAEVRVRLDIEMGQMFGFVEAAQKLDTSDTEAVLDLYRRFGDEFLVSWNLRRGGQPIPATGEGMLRLSAPLAMELVRRFRAATFAVPDPLSGDSSNGALPPAPSEEMAVSLPSLLN